MCRKFNVLRVSAETEILGIDCTLHGGTVLKSQVMPAASMGMGVKSRAFLQVNTSSALPPASGVSTSTGTALQWQTSTMPHQRHNNNNNNNSNTYNTHNTHNIGAGDTSTRIHYGNQDSIAIVPH
jgi:hypothetical protein